MSSDKLNSAIAAIKSGDKVSGSRLLAEIIKTDPSNETAWIWFSFCVDDIEKKKFCLKKALSLNPNNPYTAKELSNLEQPPQSSLEDTQPTYLTKKPSSEDIPIPNEKKPEIIPTLVKPVAASRRQDSKKIYIKESKKHSVWIVIFIIFLCVLGLCMISQFSPNTGEDIGGSPTRAKIMCESIIESRLKAPSTANFSGSLDTKMYTIENQPDSYRIIGYVDAQNSFGAQIRNNYICDIKYNGGEWTDISNWTLLNLDME
jgi:hypothetical protein